MNYEVSSHDLLGKMEEFQNHYRKLLSAILIKHNVNQSAFLIMKTIKDEHKTLKELTAITALDKSTLSRQVNTLSKKGWILKEAGTDKRYAYLYLTEEALALTNTLLFEIEQQLGFILRGWPIDEKQLLLVLLGRANRSMNHFEVQNKEEALRG
ncbi:MarR family transcriptional regulator [Desemzia sp. RIT804]|uniref:MarR family winged helix-turn-helix transcriptional regulator n=1 Tax=Desemzia sp. RIT 804 TaxID=2810209 RepID=UPI001950780D|nr:MarR family transcriptional regulator [Desemzia sp. RIT 804]MBM6613794.1 MarR family transcriptional regulator [Desemzia sp. RIT 804]